MNHKQTIALLGAALLLSSSPAWTQEQADEDPTSATIRLMSNAEAELPDEVIKTIELPGDFEEDREAVKNSARGLATANRNRLEGNKGLEQAEEAQQRGAEMAESAQENRENQGRSDDRPGPPDNPGPGSQ
jgi:regulator of protease activity HflC (stomatin/prohibitin superfamily)